MGDLLLVLRSNGKWTYAELAHKTPSEVSLSLNPTSKVTKLVPSQDWANELRKPAMMRLPAEVRVLGVHHLDVHNLRAVLLGDAQREERVVEGQRAWARALEVGEGIVQRAAVVIALHQQRRHGCVRECGESTT